MERHARQSLHETEIRVSGPFEAFHFLRCRPPVRHGHEFDGVGVGRADSPEHGMVPRPKSLGEVVEQCVGTFLGYVDHYCLSSFPEESRGVVEGLLEIVDIAGASVEQKGVVSSVKFVRLHFLRCPYGHFHTPFPGYFGHAPRRFDAVGHADVPAFLHYHLEKSASASY